VSYLLKGNTSLHEQLATTNSSRRTASWNCRDATHGPSAQPACSQERRRSA